MVIQISKKTKKQSVNPFTGRNQNGFGNKLVYHCISFVGLQILTKTTQTRCIHTTKTTKRKTKKEEKENGGVHDIKEMAMTQTIHCIFGK